MSNTTKYIIGAVILIAILFTVYKCNDSDRNQGQVDELKKEIVRWRESARAHLKDNDSLKSEIAEVKARESKHVQTITAKEAEISRLRGRLSDAKDEAAKDYPKFFSERYDMPISITPDPAPSLIANDLIEGDFAKEELAITKEVLFTERERIADRDVIIGTQGQVITNLESAVTDFEKALDVSEKAIEKQDKIIRKEKTKNVILTIAIPLAFGAGLLVN